MIFRGNIDEMNFHVSENRNIKVKKKNIRLSNITKIKISVGCMLQSEIIK